MLRIFPRLALAAALVPAAAAADGIEIGDVELGGAVRANFWDKSWENERFRPLGRYEFDTLRVRLDYTGDAPFIGSLQYRYYPYAGRRDMHFPHHAYVGYRPDADSSIVAGVNQVPFGLTPFASNSYFFSLGYYVGLEDDYDLGVKYEDASGQWNWALAYYFSDEGEGRGQSRDSARYSYDVVASPDSANDEEGQVNARLARSFKVEGWSAELGVSAQYGRIPNAATGRSGDHWAGALYMRASKGPWTVKAETIAYDYDLENPPGAPENVVIMGAYDYPYRVAASGNIHSLAISYALEPNWSWLNTVTFYNDYSILTKDAPGFADTQHNVLGASLDFPGPLFAYVDLALGKNNAWIGPAFTTALAEGAPDDEWARRFNVNLGLYF